MTLLAAASAATGFALLLAPGVSWALLLVPPVLLLRMALNAVDGMLAREPGVYAPGSSVAASPLRAGGRRCSGRGARNPLEEASVRSPHPTGSS